MRSPKCAFCRHIMFAAAQRKQAKLACNLMESNTYRNDGIKSGALYFLLLLVTVMRYTNDFSSVINKCLNLGLISIKFASINIYFKFELFIT